MAAIDSQSNFDTFLSSLMIPANNESKKKEDDKPEEKEVTEVRRVPYQSK